jgi:lipopolysaccharide/colanic/teichoic acid biosynthesis glycosyltransferase
VLLSLSWLGVLVWISIKLTSEGPGLIFQQRVGKGGRLFKCLKFRTMVANTPNMGTHEVEPSSITKLGAFLRKTKIDELPQVINLLRGEMSLVGPRPCLPNQIDVIAARELRGVFDVRPGITGLSQVYGIDMSDPARLAVTDEFYIASLSMLSEFRIIFFTFFSKAQPVICPPHPFSAKFSGD